MFSPRDPFKEDCARFLTLNVGDFHSGARPQCPAFDRSLDTGVAYQLKAILHDGMVFAQAVGQGAHRQAQSFHEAAIGAGLVERGQIVTLDVLNEGYALHIVVGEIADDAGDVIEGGAVSSPPAALTGGNLMCGRMTGCGTHKQGLQHAVGANGCR